MATTFDLTADIYRMRFYDDSATTFYDRDTTTGDYWDDTAIVGDYIYFSYDEGVFHDITVEIGTPVVITNNGGGGSYTCVWEYWERTNWRGSDGQWTTIPVLTDNTDGGSGPFTASAGSYTIEFDVPDDWTENNPSLDGRRDWIIRCQITAFGGDVDTMSEGGANATNTITLKDYTIHINDNTTIGTLYNESVSGSWDAVDVTEEIPLYVIKSNLAIENGGTLDMYVANYVTGTTLYYQWGVVVSLGTDNNRRRLIVNSGGTFLLGAREATGTRYGSRFIYHAPYYSATFPYHYGAFNIYGSTFHWFHSYSNYNMTIYGSVDWENATFQMDYEYMRVFFAVGCTGTVKNTILQHKYSSSISYTLLCYSDSVGFDNVMFGYIKGVFLGSAFLINNTDFLTDKIVHNANFNDGPVDGWVVDCKFDDLDTQIEGGSNQGTIIGYTLSLTVLDESGNEISSPYVKLENTGTFGDAITTTVRTGSATGYITATDYTGLNHNYGTFTITGSDTTPSIDGTYNTFLNDNPTKCSLYFTAAADFVVNTSAAGTWSTSNTLFDGVWAGDLLVKTADVCDHERNYTGGNIAVVSYNPIKLTVSKQGYETQFLPIELDEPTRGVTVRLKRSPFAGKDQMGENWR